MKNFYIIMILLFLSGCDAKRESTTSNETYKNITLIEACAEGLVVYRSYGGFPAMYKRTLDDKLIKCDKNKFSKD